LIVRFSKKESWIKIIKTYCRLSDRGTWHREVHFAERWTRRTTCSARVTVVYHYHFWFLHYEQLGSANASDSGGALFEFQLGTDIQPDIFLGFPLSFQPNARIIPWNKPRQVPLSSFLVQIFTLQSHLSMPNNLWRRFSVVNNVALCSYVPRWDSFLWDNLFHHLRHHIPLVFAD
jgi:hypothetical protein